MKDGSNRKRQSVTFECKTITPMFLRGADGRTPELRAPSIKGALRYWWRCLNYTSKKSLEQEAEIFGGTGENLRKSLVTIRVSGRPVSHTYGERLWNELEKRQVPNKNYFQPLEGSRGIHFLLYSVLPMNTTTNIPYIRAGTAFSVNFTSYYPHALYEAVHAFIILSYFGALGSRARRGAGCFQIENYQTQSKEIESLLNQRIKNTNISNKQDLGVFLKNLMDFRTAATSTGTVNSFANASLYIFEPQETWKEALDKVGSIYRAFRTNNKPRIDETPNFGFPVLHRSTYTTMVAGEIRENRRLLLNRRASPLTIKVVKAGQNEFYPTIIWFKSQLLPDGYKIMDKTGNNKKIPNARIVQQFISSLPTNTFLEVNL